jgi:CRISPR-associated protein Csd1
LLASTLTEFAGGKSVNLCAAAFSANGARLVVRDWFETTLDAARFNLARWFQNQTLVGSGGGEPQPLAITTLARAAVREFRDLRAPVVCALMRCALTGTRLPLALMFRAVRRNANAHRITYDRTALIKLIALSRAAHAATDSLAYLDVSNRQPAYLCGRLLSLLNAVEQLDAAERRTKTTLVDRSLVIASSCPFLVFPRLVQRARTKLRDRRGVWSEGDDPMRVSIEEIISKIGTFPVALSLEQQGIFALGFHHQRAHDRAAARAESLRAKELRRKSHDFPAREF